MKKKRIVNSDFMLTLTELHPKMTLLYDDSFMVTGAMEIKCVFLCLMS